ncbi:MAG: hypothetical protein IPK82_32225 [Polyangiaceae bacterium]|nr:hypothetical protein [Polyangiaceae bacterium]
MTTFFLAAATTFFFFGAGLATARFRGFFALTAGFAFAAFFLGEAAGRRAAARLVPDLGLSAFLVFFEVAFVAKVVTYRQRPFDLGGFAHRTGQTEPAPALARTLAISVFVRQRRADMAPILTSLF